MKIFASILRAHGSAVAEPQWPRYLIGCVLFGVAVFLMPTTPAYGGLRFCNKAALPITSAVGADYGEGWSADGWWTIWPDACVNVISGDLKKRYYYYYAYSYNKLYEWTGDGDADFCVASTRMDRLRDSDNCGQNARKQRFGKIDSGSDADYTFTFGCSQCKLPNFKYERGSNRIDAYHVVKKTVQGESVFIPISGQFTFQLDEANKLITGKVNLDFNWAHVQSKFGEIAARGINRQEECGDRISVKNVSLEPRGEIAEMRADFRYARWLCTSMDLPETTCTPEQVCVNKPPETVCDMEQRCLLGACTDVPVCYLREGGQACTDVPSCTTRMVTTQTSKNVVLEQGGSITVALRPSIVNRRDVRVSPTVTAANLDGFGQAVANLFRIDLKEKVQSFLDAGLDPDELTQTLPPEIRSVTELSAVRFYASGDKLHMTASGEFRITGTEAIKLCQQFWAAGKCTAVK